MPKLRPPFICLIVILFSLWCRGADASLEQPTPGKFITFMHKTEERQYLLHLPKNLPENAPLVFLLHGYGGDARDYMAELGLERIADESGFAVCCPQGARDFKSTPHWNARLTISKTDDIGFLSELAAHLQKRHKLNPAKTFVTGIRRTTLRAA